MDKAYRFNNKPVSYLGILKYQLPRGTRNKLNCPYIRSLLEYEFELLDGCSIYEAYLLEQIQLNAARIITGLPVFASLRSLYYETGWETLAS